MFYIVGMILGAIFAPETLKRILTLLERTPGEITKEQKIATHIVGGLLSWVTVFIYVVFLAIDKIKES